MFDIFKYLFYLILGLPNFNFNFKKGKCFFFIISTVPFIYDFDKLCILIEKR